MTKGLENVTKFPALLAELLRRGYTDEEVKKIAGLNLLRVTRAMKRTAVTLLEPSPETRRALKKRY